MIKRLRPFGLTAVFLCLLFPLLAQDDLLSELEEETFPRTTLVESTFKGTRLINGHSVETRKKGILEFVISHRFGDINSGSYNFFGLDQSNIRLALEYGISDRLYVGIGRSSFEKTFDGFAKYRLLRQATGEKAVPVSVTGFASMTIKTLRQEGVSRDFADKLAYSYQLLIARKMGERFSFQLMPSYVHFNTISESELTNGLFALGAGGRMKLTAHVALNVEYYYQFDEFRTDTYNSIAIGFDIETGGHVFQLHFTNSRSMIEKGFIAETTGDFFDGDIRFGFNITRAFQLKK